MQQRLSSSRQSLSVFLLLFWLFWLIAVLNQHPLHFQCTWKAGLFVCLFVFFFSSFPSCLPFASFSWHKDFLCWPAFFFSCSGLPNRLLAAFPPCLFAPSSPLPAQCQHHAPSSRVPLLLAPSPHLLPTCQAGSAPQFHQVAWGWGWAHCHLNSLHPRQPEMESVINGTVPGSISSGNFKLMMFK